MTLAINNRPIIFVCFHCGVKYGKNKKINEQYSKIVGYCDICEEIGTREVKRSVRPIEAYQGLINDPIFKLYEEPNP